MSMTMPFSALILAGGQSSRMGRDKALLMLNGITLLEHMQQLALTTGAAQVLVSRNQPGFIADTYPQAGPLAGILAALEYCSTSKILVLPIDAPLLSTASLMRLVHQSGGTAGYFADSPLPCVLAVNPALSTTISQQLEHGQHSVNALLTKLSARPLPASADELLNTNTPADWQHYLTLSANRNSYAKA